MYLEKKCFQTISVTSFKPFELFFYDIILMHLILDSWGLYRNIFGSSRPRFWIRTGKSSFLVPLLKVISAADKTRFTCVLPQQDDPNILKNRALYTHTHTHSHKDGTGKGSGSPVRERELFHKLQARVHLSGAKRLKENIVEGR